MTTAPINLLSEEQLKAISSGKQWSFHGGIHPQENKRQSNQAVIRDAGIPPFLVIGIEYKGHTPELLVKVGDPVLKGQPLTKVYGAMVAQHASSSGVVSAIEKRADLHPSGLAVLSVVIATDGLDRSIEYSRCADYKSQANALLIKKIQDAGIVGLGGAGFPTHLKLSHPQGIKLLIINAVECEPYISSDDRLMQEHGDEIIDGITVLQHILKAEITVIAIEDNKPEAIAAINLAVQKNQQANIIIRTIPTRYPSGSEKQLIEIISGQQTPFAKHPSELGVVMHNVGSVFAVKEAIIDGKPLTSRIVTLTGDAFRNKGNLSVRIGTPIQYLLDKYGFTAHPAQKLIIGGPMMGFTISHGDIPVTKTCNCILAPSLQEMPAPAPEVSCIRCGECAEVCPAQLLPQQLLWYSKSKEHNKLEEYNLSSCIECGACAYVCPSNIPLVEYYRIAKAEINSAQQQAKKSEIARIRFEQRAARLEQAKLDRQTKHKQAAEKRQQQLQEVNGGEDLITAALARAKAKKQAAAQRNESTENTQSAPIDSKKAAVAAAIARAKAKKQAAAQRNESTENAQSAPIDSKKAAVAAAIARAKAKKQAAAQKLKSTNDTSDNTDFKNQPENSEAIAARKKRKEQVRRDKLHKQASKTEQQALDTTPAKIQLAESTQPADDRKAKIVAAIAKAKAKKSAQKDQ